MDSSYEIIDVKDNKTIISKLSDLYLIQRKKYLMQHPNTYLTCKAGEIKKDGKKIVSLSDWHIKNHLEGKFTIGTFGGKFKSKFMTFDVDFGEDLKTAKWITYKIVDYLEQLNIKNYYVSFSGGKGYHIDLFFDDLVLIDDAKKFFNFVLSKSDVDESYYTKEIKNVEFRPTDGLGVKIPLGIHQKTKKYCGFCMVDDGLKAMDRKSSEKYLLSIKKIKSQVILDIINEKQKDNIDKDIFIKTENAIAQHKHLPSYQPTEDYSIDRAIDYLQNGLKVKGSRHNIVLLIAMYLKYCGLDQSECKNELYQWMNNQNIDMYTTKIEDCYKDIDQVIKDVFERNYYIKTKEKNITVTYDEIKTIIEKCPELNQKLITYAMLVHSKRFADMQGVFFMSFPQKSEATGLSLPTTKRQIDKLIEIGIVEAIERNRKQMGSKMNLPNKYRINLEIDSQNDINNVQEEYKVNKQNDFTQCVNYYFTENELKSMFSVRQYKTMVSR